jgi:hypothetical protein
VAGSYAYVATSEGLEIVDISDPGHPTRTARFGDGGDGKGLAVQGNLVYFADMQHGLEVIDVSEPLSPKKLGTVPGTESAWDIHIHGEMLYLGCHGAGVRIVDLSEPESPRVVGRFHDGREGEAQGVWGDGEFLFVADNFDGVEVLAVGDPTAPYQIGAYRRIEGVHELAVEEGFVYAADASKGLVVLEFKEDALR